MSPLILFVAISAASAAAGDLPIRRGDADIDQVLDISDAIGILGYLFLGEPPTIPCQAATDTNHDVQVDISDPIYLINSLFLGGPAPDHLPLPCGIGPPAADLECAAYCPCQELFFGTVYCGRVAAGSDPCSMGLHRFSANAGDQVRIRVITPGEVDLVVEVFDSSEALILSGGGAASYNVVLDFAILEQGPSYVVVRDDDGQSSGSYCMSLERLNNPTHFLTLAFGDPRTSARIDERSEMDVYSFEAQLGDQALISVVSPGEVDLVVEVFDSMGTRLKSGGGAGSFEVQLECPIAAAGKYYILVADDDGLSLGEYSISLSR